MSILQVKDLHKSFGSTEIIKGISFSLSEGEILGLLGPNGAGKTTTIQMIIGTLTPTRGSIEIFGLDNQIHREQIAEKLNFSSTYNNLPWWLTVKENLTWSAYLYDIPDRAKRMDKIKALFHLDKLWHKQIRQLSSGQQTRVGLARACLNFPKVLVLDEPTASLDPDIAQYIHEFLMNERKEFRTSVILTSHNMSEVESLCNRVLILKEGKIIAEDTPAGLSKRITRCRLLLTITKNSTGLNAYLAKHKYQSFRDKNKFEITVPDNKIAAFLNHIGQLDIKYSEISIDKPDLKDYFLAIARPNAGHKPSGKIPK